MNKVSSQVLIILLVLFSAVVQAEDLPDIIESGLEIYKEKGSGAAVEAWIKGGPMDGTGDFLPNASTLLEQIDGFFGEYQSRDVYKKNSLGPRSNVYLVTLNYTKGVLYAKFFTYKPEKGKEILQSFDFATEVDQVWPSFIVYGK